MIQIAEGYWLHIGRNLSLITV